MNILDLPDELLSYIINLLSIRCDEIRSSADPSLKTLWALSLTCRGLTGHATTTLYREVKLLLDDRVQQTLQKIPNRRLGVGKLNALFRAFRSSSNYHFELIPREPRWITYLRTCKECPDRFDHLQAVHLDYFARPEQFPCGPDSPKELLTFLTQAKNLRKLCITTRHRRWWSALLEQIAQDSPCFKKVTEVKMTIAGTWDFTVQDFVMLCKLPGLRILKIEAPQMRGEVLKDIPAPQEAPNLQEIEVRCQWIARDTLVFLVDQVPRAKRLVLPHLYPEDARMYSQKILLYPATIVESLRPLGQTLEHLAIASAGTLYPHFRCAESIRGFSDFGSLKSLDVPGMYMFENELVADNVPPYQVLDLIPASIESITVRFDSNEGLFYTVEQLRDFGARGLALWKGFSKYYTPGVNQLSRLPRWVDVMIEEKGQKFPNLKKVEAHEDVCNLTGGYGRCGGLAPLIVTDCTVPTALNGVDVSIRLRMLLATRYRK